MVSKFGLVIVLFIIKIYVITVQKVKRQFYKLGNGKISIFLFVIFVNDYEFQYNL